MELVTFGGLLLNDGNSKNSSLNIKLTSHSSLNLCCCDMGGLFVHVLYCVVSGQQQS